MYLQKLLKSLFYLLFLFQLNNGWSIYSASASQNSGQLPANAIVNISAHSFVDKLTIHWSINYDEYEKIKENNYNIAIRYCSGENYKQDSTKWEILKGIPISLTKYEIKNLDENTSYHYSIGIDSGKQTTWFGKHQARTELSWGIFKFIVLIGALGLFIYGMKVMSEGVQQVLGAGLRNQLGSITSNRFKGILAGFSISSIIQSSTVAIIMTSSFVNAGILSLTQSAGVIIGANIGTTIKAWFINLLAFEIDLSAYALFILAFAAPVLFFGKKRWKPWVSAIFGFVFLFMGLSFMVESLPQNSNEIPLLEKMLSYNETAFWGSLLFVILGILITILLQSSSATMVLVMGFVYKGLLPFDVAIAIILGANIGTAIVVEFASSAGNVHAKRSARINTLFNFIGFIWVILLLPISIKAIQWGMVKTGWGDPINNPTEFANAGLALFHTGFNVVNTILLVGFIPQLVKWSEKMVKSKGKSDELFHLEFIDTGILSTPDLSILEAKKEIAKFGILIQKMANMTKPLLFEKNPKQIEKIATRIHKYEDITDRIEVEVVKYLNKIAEGNLTEQTATQIRGMNSMVNDLERIGDVFYQISKTYERKTAERLWFTPEQRTNLNQLFELVDDAIIIMCDNLNAPREKVQLEKAYLAEKKINQFRNKLRKEYLENLTNDNLNIKGGMIYNDLFSSLEKAGDLIINISEAIVGKV